MCNAYIPQNAHTLQMLMFGTKLVKSPAARRKNAQCMPTCSYLP